MAPLDWDHLMSLDMEAFEEEQADDLYDVLAEFDPGEEKDAERLMKLYLVTQSVMIVKGTQAQVAEEELADKASSEGKSGAKKDQEIEDLKREIQTLKRENKDMQRFGKDAGTGGASRETRFLRDELNELEHQVSLLQKDMKEKDKQLTEEKELSERYIARAEDGEKELRELRRENDQMREDVRDYQRQLEAQRETMLSKRDEDFEVRDKIVHKNKLLNAALEENRNLAESNVELEKKIEDLKKEMNEGRHEMEETADRYLKLRTLVDQGDQMIENLRRENEMLKGQVDDLMDQVKTKADADDEIMVQVNNKVEQWKGVLSDKEERVYDLQEQVIKLREQLTAANMDSEKASVAMLTKALEERDKQIETLRRRLDEASGDMEANAALIQDVHSQMNRTSVGSADPHMKKIGTLQSTIKMHESQLKDADVRAHEAEEDAREKDKQLSEALDKINQYEMGIYGLPEAVAEIKTIKQQGQMKDRQIEELTQYINRVEMEINDVKDENDDFRERLGLGPREEVNLTEFKKRKGMRLQEDRALNRVLQQELEKMEEERIELKQQIRKLAQATGQRAVALGLGADDLLAVDNFIEDLKVKNTGSAATKTIKSRSEKDMLEIKNHQLGSDLASNEKQLQQLNQQNVEMKAKMKEMHEENDHLEKGMREILTSIQEQGSSDGGEVLHCPTLERMLAAMETRRLTGNYDAALYLKAQVDNLTGHNEELRKTLRETRVESTKANVELDRAKTKMMDLQSEIKTLREVGAGGFFQSMPLPEGMAVTSADVIASLNEHLTQVLQELSLKEEMVEKMEASLENNRRKFAVVRHQQSLLYQEHLHEKESWEDDKKRLREELEKLQGMRDEDNVRLQEFDRLVDTLGQDDSEVRRRLSDMTRKITVLRVNEKALARRYCALQDIEANLQKEGTKLKSDMIAMETAVAERLGYLQRYKDMATFKIATLQRSLEESVPEVDLVKANKQYMELTEKYRDMLERTNSLVARSEQTSGYEVEVKHLHDDNNILKQELAIEKEKLHTLEAAFEQLRKQGMASSKDLTNSEIVSISHKLTTLEMKELNERQRADHAHNMYNQQKVTLRQLEDRNFELEQKFAELTKMNLQSQKVERELRDELSSCVMKSVSDNDRKRIQELEFSEAHLRDEISKLKDISDVATSQVRAIESQQQTRNKEIISLRQQLVDFQAQSDEKTVIGKLHRHIVQLQVSEGMAVRRLDDSLKKINKLEAQLLRTEQKLDTRDQTIYHNRQEARSKNRHLKLTVQDLRRKFTGAIPLQQQERFADAMVKLQEDKSLIQQELTKTQKEREAVEDKLAELELRHGGLQDLIATLKDGKGAQKVAEWHSKMEALRLEDLRHRREIDRHKQQVKFMETLSKQHESEVTSLEEDKVRQARAFEARELDWEQREVELERIIASMERQQAAIAGAATEFEEAVGQLPDPSWPVAQQLEHAVTSIKRNIKHILDTKAEMEHLRTRINELQDEIRGKEKEVLSRDKVITELRLRMPASLERDEMILKAQQKAASGESDPEDYEGRQAVRVATETVAGLQTRLAQKEHVLVKHRELLKQARDDARLENDRNRQELQAIQAKLHNKHDDALSKFKQTVRDSLNKPDATIPTNEQLKRLNELEDMLAEQENSVAALREKLMKTRKESQDWRYRYEDAVRHHAEEKASLMGDHQDTIVQLQVELDGIHHQLGDKSKQLEVTEDELAAQREENVRAPTTTMKNLVERLRNQLSLKEKQHQALSKALLELRADMVNQAGEDAKANADQALMELNVQKAVDRQTKDLQERLEEVDAISSRLKREVRKLKDRDAVQSTELEETKRDLLKKDTLVKKLKQDKSRLEAEVDDLEKKVNRMGTMAKQRAADGDVEGPQAELEELRRRNRLLTEDLKRSKHQAEKPYEQTAGKDPAPGSREEVVLKWEESKKWQKMVDRMKQRVKEKDAELEKSLKMNEMLKNGLERANKDKETLEARMKSLSKLSVEPAVGVQRPPPVNAAPPRGPAAHAMEELRKTNNDLEEQVAQLKRRLTQGRDSQMEEVQLRNKFLAEKLAQMEGEIAKRMTTQTFHPKQEETVGHDTYRELANRENDLQKKVIKLSEENIELRFEVEQGNKDIPRLKKRVDDLQKYIEVLKVEKEELKMMRSSNQSLASLASSYSSSNIRRIGDSGKTPQELEKTVALLKKVVERCQAENRQLKQTPGIVSNEALHHLQEENHGLKSQLEEVRQRMGANLSERYQSQQRGTARVVADHEQLRKDLIKEKESNEKLRVKIGQQKVTIEQLQRQLEETEHRLEAATKKPTLGSLDTKEWKAAVIPRLNEEKIKALEDEVDSKNRALKDVKILLRDAAEREQALLHEKQDMEEKMHILEAFPPGVNVKDAQLIQEYQTSRLTVDRLEKEKKGLLYEMQVLRKQVNSGAGGPSDVNEDEIVNKIQSYDRMMTENVDLMTQVKGTQLEKDKLQQQVSKLKTELSNFGPEFFDEIEDLKYNYRESVQRNVQYEEQLRQLSTQFGVAVDIPAV